jgi:hypothetical protein
MSCVIQAEVISREDGSSFRAVANWENSTSFSKRGDDSCSDVDELGAVSGDSSEKMLLGVRSFCTSLENQFAGEKPSRLIELIQVLSAASTPAAQVRRSRQRIKRHAPLRSDFTETISAFSLKTCQRNFQNYRRKVIHT